MKGKKVLIIEDNFEIAEIVAILLEKEGYDITGIVGRGDEALISAAEVHPDVVITDINLEGEIDGIETAKYLSHLFRIPIIFMTGVVDHEIIAKAKSAEPYGYLQKPFKNKELLSTISLAIRTFELSMKSQDLCSSKVPSCVRQMSSHEEGIMITNPAGRILYMNPYTEGLTGLSNTDMIFKSVSDILRISDKEISDLPDGNLISEISGIFPSLDDDRSVFITDRSGGRVMVRIRVVPKKYRDEDTIGSIITLKELAEHERAGVRDAGTIPGPDIRARA